MMNFEIFDRNIMTKKEKNIRFDDSKQVKNKTYFMLNRLNLFWILIFEF